MAGSDGRIVIDVILDDGQVVKGIADIDGKLGSVGRSGEASSFGVGKLVTALGLVALASKGIDMVKGSMDKAFGRIDTFERFDRVMTVLTGSAEQTKQALDRTNEAVTGTAYGLDVAASAVQGFVARSLDVDKATSYIESFGDAVAFYGEGTNEAFERVTSAMQEAVSSGKVTGDTLNTLYSQGIQGPEMYAAATGKSLESVRKDLSSGKISAEEFFDVVGDVIMQGTEGFPAIAGAAKEAGASWTSVFGNMQTAIARGVASIIEAIDELLTSNGLPDMRTMIADFGKEFEKVLKGVAEYVPIVAQGLFDLYGAIKPFLPLMTAVALGVGSVLLAFATYNTAVAMIERVKTAMKALNVVASANPWALVAMAVIAAVYLIYVYWEPISEFFINLWEGIKEVTASVWEAMQEAWTASVEYLKELWTGIKEFFSELWNSIVEVVNQTIESINQAWEGFKEFFIELWNGFVEIITAVFEPIIEYMRPLIDGIIELWGTVKESIVEIWTNITEMLTTVWDNISSIASSAWELIKMAVLTPILVLIQLLTGNWEDAKNSLAQIWERVKAEASNIWESIKSIVSAIVTGWINHIKTSWETAKSALGTIWNAIKGMAINAWNLIKTSVSNIVTTLVNGIKTSWEFLKNTLTNLMESIKTGITTAWNNIKTSAVNIVKNIITDIVTKWEELKTQTLEKIQQVKDNVINPLKEIDLMQIGKDIVQGFIDGIKSKVTAVADAAKEMADAVTGKIKSILNIQSPSRVMREIGDDTGTGMAIGIEGTKERNAKAMAEIGQVVKAVANENAKELRDAELENSKKLMELEKKQNESLSRKRAQYQKAKKKDALSHNREIAKINEEAQRNFEKQQIQHNKKIATIQAKEEKSRLDAIKLYIDNKKSLNELSLIDEAYLWETQMKLFKEGTQERVKAQQEYQKAVEDVQKNIVTINEKYGKEMQDINKKLKDEEDRLWDDFVKTRENRAKEIAGFASLFEEFNITQEKSGEKLLENLDGQVQGLEEWINTIEEVGQRIQNEDLMKELTSLGPKALGELKALNELTDEQLAYYEELYWRKFALARMKAGEETEGMKQDVFENIDAMREEANKELELLGLEWVTAMKTLTGETDKELQSLEQIGRDAGQGLYDGLASMEDAIVNKAISIAEAVKDAMSSALDIHSPSRWMRDFLVGNMAKGFEVGVNKFMGVFERGGEAIGEAVKPKNISVSHLGERLPRMSGLRNASNSSEIAKSSSSNSVVYDITNHFTPKESTPSESAKKQRDMLYQLGIEYR